MASEWYFLDAAFGRFTLRSSIHKGLGTTINPKSCDILTMARHKERLKNARRPLCKSRVMVTHRPCYSVLCSLVIHSGWPPRVHTQIFRLRTVERRIQQENFIILLEKACDKTFLLIKMISECRTKTLYNRSCKGQPFSLKNRTLCLDNFTI